MATNPQRAGVERAPVTAQRQKLRRAADAPAAAVSRAYACAGRAKTYAERNATRNPKDAPLKHKKSYGPLPIALFKRQRHRTIRHHLAASRGKSNA